MKSRFYMLKHCVRLVNGIQDPFLGPKNMRPLLFLRGFSGYLFCYQFSTIADLFRNEQYRFIGLYGIYFSLQYLSLSDATVLTFLAPICTVFTGALFLGETFSRRQVLAGSEVLLIIFSLFYTIHVSHNAWAR
jgi:drug/metabolite transporter (DMT)-like permease